MDLECHFFLNPPVVEDLGNWRPMLILHKSQPKWRGYVWKDASVLDCKRFVGH